MAIETKDFEEFMVEENLHVAINVKDFKAVITHADTAKVIVTARYTRPCRPLQLAYEFEGVTCEFTLMTRGEADDEAPSASRTGTPELSARQTPRPVQVNRFKNVPTAEQMPPPASRTTQPPVQASARQSEGDNVPTRRIDYDSLFIPADDDRQWDEPNYEDEAEDMIGWDASAEPVYLSSSFQCEKTTDIDQRGRLTQVSVSASKTESPQCPIDNSKGLPTMTNSRFHPHNAYRRYRISVGLFVAGANQLIGPWPGPLRLRWHVADVPS